MNPNYIYRYNNKIIYLNINYMGTVRIHRAHLKGLGVIILRSLTLTQYI